MHTKIYVAFAEAIKKEMGQIPIYQGAAINQTQDDYFDQGQRAGIEKMARRIAEICRKDNERFNVDQFLVAAGVK